MARKEYLRDQSIPHPTARFNFLLGCSDSDLSDFELARLAAVANLRTDLHVIFDKLIDEMAQAALAGWFRQTNRETLKRAIDNPDDALAWAREQIRCQGKEGESQVPRTALEPGAAHLAAALRYQQRNIAEGKCAICPKPLARNSVRFCEKHLAMARARMQAKNAKGQPPGSIEWLYSGTFESSQGKRPGTVKALRENRKNPAKKRGVT